MKKWITTIVIIGTVSVALTALALPRGGEGQKQGKPEGPRGPSGGGGMGIGLVMHDPEIAQEAGVTDEQIEQIRDLAYENRRAQIPLQSELSLAQMDLEHLVSQDQPDTAAIDAAIENVGRIEMELQKLQVHQRIAIQEILGADVIGNIQRIAREKMQERHGNQNGRSDNHPRRFSRRDQNQSGGCRSGWAPPPPESEEPAEN